MYDSTHIHIYKTHNSTHRRNKLIHTYINANIQRQKYKHVQLYINSNTKLPKGTSTSIRSIHIYDYTPIKYKEYTYTNIQIENLTNIHI